MHNEDFIEAAKAEVDRAGYDFKRFIVARKCSECGKVRSDGFSCSCGSWNYSTIEDPEFGGYLPIPSEFQSMITGSEYGGWGSIGLANARVFSEETEDLAVAVFGLFSHCYPNAGYRYAFDPTDEETVEFLADFFGGLDGYPVADDETLDEVEQELIEENIDSWALSDLTRDAIGELGSSLVEGIDPTVEAEIVRAIDALETDEFEEQAREICYAHHGYYSADDFGLHDDAPKVLAAIALGFENSDRYFEIGWGAWKAAIAFAADKGIA